MKDYNYRNAIEEGYTHAVLYKGNRGGWIIINYFMDSGRAERCVRLNSRIKSENETYKAVRLDYIHNFIL